MQRALTTLAFVLALAGFGHLAAARQVRYVGSHPIPEQAGGGYCNIEVPHVHIYAPAKPELLYRKHGADYYFVGDPVATHGYDGPRHAYYGPHPIHVDVLVGDADVPEDDPAYCYIEGPHYHTFLPPTGTTFTLRGDAYWYVGSYPAEYQRERPRYVAINAYYHPLRYERPVVVVDPPVGYLGPVVAVDVRGPAVEVATPVVEAGFHAGVEVRLPTPLFEVGFGGPVYVEQPRYRVRRERDDDDERGDDDDHGRGRGHGWGWGHGEGHGKHDDHDYRGGRIDFRDHRR